MNPTAEGWKRVFVNWPPKLQRRGLVTTTLDETIPFKAFLISDEMLALERTNPDPLGTRVILLDFGSIALLKIIDPIGAEALAPLGFSGKFSN